MLPLGQVLSLLALVLQCPTDRLPPLRLTDQVLALDLLRPALVQLGDVVLVHSISCAMRSGMSPHAASSNSRRISWGSATMAVSPLASLPWPIMYLMVTLSLTLPMQAGIWTPVPLITSPVT